MCVVPGFWVGVELFPGCFAEHGVYGLGGVVVEVWVSKGSSTT